MRRVAIIGCGGSGKSTLARRLGAATGLPVVHLDRHFWNPGWVETPQEAWIARHADLVAGDRWIVDGNYSRHLAPRLAAADTIVLLDLPRRTCLARIARRWWTWRGRTRPDLPEGCPESLDWKFLRWVWRFPRDSRPSVLAAVEAHREGRRVEILRTEGEIERFARSVEREAGARAGPTRPVRGEAATAR